MERDYQIVSMALGVYDRLGLKPVRARALIARLPQLCTIARSVHHLDEHDCNGVLTDKMRRRRDTLLANAAGLVQEAVGKRSLVHIRHQGDPRGAALQIVEGEDAEPGVRLC